MAKQVFLIDADAAIRDSLVTLGEVVGFTTRCFPSAEQFLNARQDLLGACILCEANLPGMAGLDLFKGLRLGNRDLPFALLMSEDNPSLAAAARSAGVATIFRKPLTPSPLMAFIEQPQGFII